MNSFQKLLHIKLVVLLLLGGCQAPLHFNRAEPKFITIDIENKTFEVGVDILVTEKIENELIFKGLGVVENKREAALRLSGQITTYTDDKKVEWYYISIGGYFTLKDLQNNKILWKNKVIKGNSTAPNRVEAKKRALTDIAGNIVNYIVDNEN